MRNPSSNPVIVALSVGLWVTAIGGCGTTSPGPANDMGSGASASSATTGASSGASAGSTTTSGSTSGGLAGSVCPGTNCDLIDDMEAAGVGMMNDGIVMNEGRTGYWYVYNDMSPAGMQVPDPATHSFIPEKLMPARGTSLYAAHTSGTGFTVWGAGFGFDINNPGGGDGGNGAPMPYDTTKFGFKGIYFFAKVGATSTTSVRVLMSDKSSNPAAGVCNPAATAPHGMQCSDDAGFTLTLTNDWQGYAVPFSSLSRSGFGPPGAFDPTTLYYIHWQVTQNNQFDITIDDIYFTK